MPTFEMRILITFLNKIKIYQQYFRVKNNMLIIKRNTWESLVFRISQISFKFTFLNENAKTIETGRSFPCKHRQSRLMQLQVRKLLSRVIRDYYFIISLQQEHCCIIENLAIASRY